MDDASEFQLCSICSKIPFDIVFSGKADTNLRFWRLPFLDEWAETCSLCSFLLQCLPMRVQLQCAGERIRTDLSLWSQHVEDPDVKTLRLSLFSHKDSSRIFSLETIFCITSKGQQTAGQPKMIPPLVSYATITEWMNRTIPYLESPSGPAGELQSVVPLAVIDCITRKLILLPEKEPYVTLSYVWGSVDSGQTAPGPGKDGHRFLPSQLPSTIEDCITVCLGLSFRYLWVDRYCIYGSHEARAQQIQQMDSVYSKSALTVIACAGSDSTYGLPGVSRLRTPYPSLKIKDLGYMWTTPAIDDIEDSIWATRGWTFQEALLSKHQLYFTDKQMFLGFYDRIEGELGDFGSRAVPEKSTSIHTLESLSTYDCIREYSGRNLSYPEDILNAFLGILSRFQKDRGVFHLWGVPFKGSEHALAMGPNSSYELVFEESLCWRTDKPARREGFPTWSWTSNKGQVWWPQSLPSQIGCERWNTKLAPKFEVELISGGLCSLSGYHLHYDRLNKYSEGILSKYRASRFIHVEALMSPVVKMGAFDDGSNKVVLWSTSGDLIFLDIPGHTTFTQMSAVSASVVHLIYDVRFRVNYALIVSNMGNHWERVDVVIDRDLVLDGAEKIRQKIRLG